MLTYRYANYLEVVGYVDLDLDRYVDTIKSTSRYLFFLLKVLYLGK